MLLLIHRLSLLSVLLTLAASPRTATTSASQPRTSASRALHVVPASLKLVGPEAEHGLLVTVIDADGMERDATRTARYASSKPSVARVSSHGVIRIAGDGYAEIRVDAGGRTARVRVSTRDAARPQPLSFTNDILPVLSRAGCNQGSCHGKASGQGGFKLSVLAFDPRADHAAITREAHGRRVRRAAPEQSLLLLKPTASLPHGGGRRFAVGSREYRLLRRWIAEGMPFDPPREPALARIEVYPAERVLGPQREQQLLVTAVYSDGSRRDVTRRASYRSNEGEIADVDADGLVRTEDLAGEAAVMVRYMGQMAVSRITVPLSRPLAPRTDARRIGSGPPRDAVVASSGVFHRIGSGPPRDAVVASGHARSGGQPRSGSGAFHLPRVNFIDELVLRKLERLRIVPSGRCTDAEFVRRAFLDLIGTLPTAEEARAFVADRDPDKRAKLVDALLERPEYADYWGLRWADVLLVNRDPLFPKGAYAYDRWVREQFRRNRPYNEMAYDVLTAQGYTYRDGPANFFRSVPSPEPAAIAVSQLFLGVRLECAQCHHHPYERWSQDDFYSLAAYFARMRRKGNTEYESIVYVGKTGEVKHPRTGQVMLPRPLLPLPATDGGRKAEGGTARRVVRRNEAEGPDRPAGDTGTRAEGAGARTRGYPLQPPTPAVDAADPRIELARWVTAPENPFFARVAVNRVWAAVMGRGLFEPVDDQRTTNPASNEPLLDALAKEFVRNGYDFKHLLRTILLSETYQRSSRANATNARDTRNYSRAYVRRLPAEVLMDAIGQVTGAPEPFNGLPPGLRATQLWDSKLVNYFLSVFGRPERLSVCTCDRSDEGSVTQALHLMNSSGIQAKLAAEDGRAARLAASSLTEAQIVTELYLAAYSRHPTVQERRAALAAYRRPGATRRTATEDILWALINSPEFVFNH